VVSGQHDQWLFFGVVPAVLGLLVFSLGGPPASDVPSAAGLLFWITAAPLWWAVLHAATLLVARTTRALALPRWAILGAGSLLALPVVRALYISMGAFYLDLFDSSYRVEVAPLFELSWSFLGSMIRQAAWLWVSWIGLNCLLDHYIGRRRYQPSAADGSALAPEATSRMLELHRAFVPDSTESSKLATHPTVPAPELDLPSPPTANGAATSPVTTPGFRDVPDFMTKVPISRRGALIAIKAEDHYLKVTTSKGESLVHYRISDAIGEMPDETGIRVHRSHWVARDAISRCDAAGRSLRLTLVNGAVVPVSQSYKQPVLRFCRAAGHDPTHADE